MKKAQATMFIILALIIVVVIAIAYSYRGSIMEKARGLDVLPTVSLPPELSAVHEDLEGCLENVGLGALVLLGDSGGYLYPGSVKTMDYGEDNVAYLYYKGDGYVPSVDKMEKDLEKHMAGAVSKCEKDYPNFDKTTYGKAKAGVGIDPKKVEFDIRWPVTLEKEGAPKSTLQDFGFSFSIRLGEVRDIVGEIVELQIADSDNICLSCLNEMAKAEDFTITTDNFNYQEGDLVYWIVTDYELKGGGHNYIFTYANKFEG